MGLGGPMVLEKWGPYYKMWVLCDFVSYHFIKSRINETLNIGAFVWQIIAKLSYEIVWGTVARPHSECTPGILSSWSY